MANSSKAPVDNSMFRPPVNRSMRVLDRSFFQKKVSLAAARIFEARNIAECRTNLQNELLNLERVSAVKQDQNRNNLKALLLRPDIRPHGHYTQATKTCDVHVLIITDSSSWSSTVLKLIEAQKIAITTYDLELNYDHWTYRMYVTRIFPVSREF